MHPTDRPSCRLGKPRQWANSEPARLRAMFRFLAGGGMESSGSKFAEVARAGQVVRTLRRWLDLLKQRDARHLGNIAGIDEVHSAIPCSASPGPGGDVWPHALEHIGEGRQPQDRRRDRLPCQMRLDLHMPGEGQKPGRRTEGGQFDDVPNACCDGCIDQRDFVDDLFEGGAMRDEEPVDAAQGPAERLSAFEVDLGNGPLRAVALGWIGASARRDRPDRRRAAPSICPQRVLSHPRELGMACTPARRSPACERSSHPRRAPSGMRPRRQSP